jgi:hypothetical protein
MKPRCCHAGLDPASRTTLTLQNRYGVLKKFIVSAPFPKLNVFFSIEFHIVHAYIELCQNKRWRKIRSA